MTQHERAQKLTCRNISIALFAYRSFFICKLSSVRTFKAVCNPDDYGKLVSVLVHEVLGGQLLMVELERSDLDVCDAGWPRPAHTNE